MTSTGAKSRALIRNRLLQFRTAFPVATKNHAVRSLGEIHQAIVSIYVAEKLSDRGIFLVDPASLLRLSRAGNVPEQHDTRPLVGHAVFPGLRVIVGVTGERRRVLSRPSELLGIDVKRCVGHVARA